MVTTQNFKCILCHCVALCGQNNKYYIMYILQFKNIYLETKREQGF